MRFPGLKEGMVWTMDRWWFKYMYDFEMAPPVILKSTHKKMLEILPLKKLEYFSIDEWLGILLEIIRSYIMLRFYQIYFLFFKNKYLYNF